MSDALQTARDAWGADLPDWIEKLAEACEASSQARVAAQIGRSGAVVSQVLRAKYKGSMISIEELVRGALMGDVVECPALGFLPMHECHDWRRKARVFAGNNALRVQMYRACHQCPRNRPQDAPQPEEGAGS